MEAIRRIQFCAGHRVYKHESKCSNLHGHNYVAFFYAKAIEDNNPLDNIGRVIDFSVLKKIIGGWIDDNLDHGFIYFDEDEYVSEICKSSSLKSYKLKSNPTAENIADHMLRDICPKLMLETGIEITKIVLWETENCFVEVKL